MFFFNNQRNNQFKHITEVKKNLLERVEHQWIKKDPFILRSFIIFIEIVPLHFWNVIAKNKMPIFISVSGKYGCAVDSMNSGPVILIYRDLKKILRSASRLKGVSILAHELGHIYHRHAASKKTSLQCQFEADQFAVDCGLKYELFEFLQDHSEIEECQIRYDKLINL